MARTGGASSASSTATPPPPFTRPNPQIDPQQAAQRLQELSKLVQEAAQIVVATGKDMGGGRTGEGRRRDE